MQNPGTMDLPALPASETIGSKAATVLRDAISRGAIPAGITLRLDDLARQFGVSRIPLRDALRQLEKEGFVAVTPYRGAKVLPVSIEESREISELSELLHAAMLRHVFPLLTPAILDETERLLHLRAKAADSIEWTRISDELLQVMYGPANKPFLVNELKSVTDQSLRYLHLFLPQVIAGHLPKSTFFDVIAACRQGDLDGALRALQETHVASRAVVEEAIRRKAKDEAEPIRVRKRLGEQRSE